MTWPLPAFQPPLKPHTSIRFPNHAMPLLQASIAEPRPGVSPLPLHLQLTYHSLGVL